MNVNETFQDQSPTDHAFYRDVIDGLSQTQKSLPCKYFYDERGSQLFDQICTLEEYYPTRTELGLLEQYGAEIAARVGPGASMVEFGCGSLQKIRILLAALEAPQRFIPIDISREHLLASAEALAADFPSLEIAPLCADYTQPLDVPLADDGSKRVGFFPGSTIGNFDHEEAVAFMSVMADLLGQGGELIIGVDLKKPESILHAAYNDAQGVTAAFNLNILERINRELDGEFDLKQFRHDARYLPDEGRIEMHIASTTDQQVKVNGHVFSFAADETIHTENSHKYGLEEFIDLAGKAGFVPVTHWVDAEDLFSIHYLRVA